MQDEGVGVQVVRALEERYELPPELEVVDGGTFGLDLLPYMEGRERVLFVDAVNFRQDPGYIGVLENEEIPALFAAKESLHHLGLMDVLATAKLLDVSPGKSASSASNPCAGYWHRTIRVTARKNGSAVGSNHCQVKGMAPQCNSARA